MPSYPWPQGRCTLRLRSACRRLASSTRAGTIRRPAGSPWARGWCSNPRSPPARSASTRRVPTGTAWTELRWRPWRNGSHRRWRARCPSRWSMSKLSAYVITYNEEAKIRDALESIKWVDEIVVLDSHSTDRTEQICKEYTGRFYQCDFEGFGKLRNQALALVTHDWVFSLDADERVTDELREEIRRELASGPRADAFFVPRKNFFLGRWIRHCGWYPDYRQPQFFNKHRLRYRDDLVHEGFDLTGKVDYLRG